MVLVRAIPTDSSHVAVNLGYQPVDRLDILLAMSIEQLHDLLLRIFATDIQDFVEEKRFYLHFFC